jgi:hypothetical protein
MGATKLLTAAGGGVTLDAASTATDKTVTIPARTGTVSLDGPAFSAYGNAPSGQTLTSGVLTKITCNAEEFDTNSNYDTSNSRFTPTVAGYYLFTGHIQPQASYTAGVTAMYKNGSLAKYGSYNANATGVAPPSMTCLIYMNGSTDYVEFYASLVTGQAIDGGSYFGYFQGHMARAA